jgi:hypothetical protein
MDSGKLPASIAEVKPGLKKPPPEPKEPEEKPETHVVLKPGDEMHPMPKKNQTIKVPPKKEKKAASDLLTLVQDYAILQGLMPSLVQKRELTIEHAHRVNEELETLTPDDVQAFNSLLAMYVFGSDDADLSQVIAACRS